MILNALTGVKERIPEAVRDRLSAAISQLAAAVALIAVIIFLSIVSDDFLTADNLSTSAPRSPTPRSWRRRDAGDNHRGHRPLGGLGGGALGRARGDGDERTRSAPPLGILGARWSGRGGAGERAPDLGGRPQPVYRDARMLTVARGLAYVVTDAVAVFGRLPPSGSWGRGFSSAV